MLSIEAKQSVKRLMAKATSSLVSEVDAKLSAILNYHSIHPTHDFSTKPHDFQQQMDYLSSNFTVISLHDFYIMRIKGEDLPGMLAMVTFDDGYEDNYQYAYPLLKRFGIRATIFATTGFLNGEIDITQKHTAYRGLRALKWNQILEMRDAGISFGSHTHKHLVLSTIPLEIAEIEICKSKSMLEDKLSEPVDLFAYPLGQRGTFNRSIIELLKKHGFKLGVSTIWGNDNSKKDIYALRRIRIDACDTINDFKEKVNGKWDFIRWAQMIKR